jgi:hypothetical protein
LKGDVIIGDDVIGDDVIGDVINGDDVIGDVIIGDDVIGDVIIGDDVIGDDVPLRRGLPQRRRQRYFQRVRWRCRCLLLLGRVLVGHRVPSRAAVCVLGRPPNVAYKFLKEERTEHEK